MASNSMLTYTVRLDQQPGGVSPEIHLKQGANSMNIQFILSPSTTLINANAKRCVIRGTRPDGSAVFITSFSVWENHEIMVSLYSYDITKLVAVPGEYKCTLTILDVNAQVTRETYMNYDFLTVLPFTVIVHQAAYEEEG